MWVSDQLIKEAMSKIWSFFITKLIPSWFCLFIEAEMAKNRVSELKEQQYSLETQEMLFNHQQQREECEAAHIKQYQEFNQHWDRELQTAQDEDQQEIQSAENAHTKALEENRQKMETELPMTFKFSAELLNLRKIQTNLAKQKNY